MPNPKRARRHSDEEIGQKLKEADQMASDGKTVQEIAKTLKVSDATLYYWRRKAALAHAGVKKAAARKALNQRPHAGMILHDEGLLHNGHEATPTSVAQVSQEDYNRLVEENTLFRSLIGEVVINRLFPGGVIESLKTTNHGGESRPANLNS